MQRVADVVGVIDDIKREYQSPDCRINDFDNPDTLAMHSTDDTRYVGRTA